MFLSGAWHFWIVCSFLVDTSLPYQSVQSYLGVFRKQEPPSKWPFVLGAQSKTYAGYGVLILQKFLTFSSVSQMSQMGHPRSLAAFLEKKVDSGPGIYLIILLSSIQAKYHHCLRSLSLQIAMQREITICDSVGTVRKHCKHAHREVSF